LPDIATTQIYAYSKPELMFNSLEKIIGKVSFNNAVKDYYQKYKYSHPKGDDLINIFKENTAIDLTSFFDNVYKQASLFDYSVNKIEYIESTNEYEIFLERKGDGIFNLDVAVYTNKDTLYFNWDGTQRWKKLVVKTNNKVLAAEIDPFRKNIFDINYANNSYTVDYQYQGSVSIAVRFFFYLQNLLLLLSGLS